MAIIRESTVGTNTAMIRRLFAVYLLVEAMSSFIARHN
jgi:hypothetical protein